jgi:diketogulonate reductase-like aldo/keto reductase
MDPASIHKPEHSTNMSAMSPEIILNNGIKMPALGLGVYKIPQETTARAVEVAIAHGYRLIDTASVYFNEREVGAGIGHSGIGRTEIFITTKLWISDYGYERARRAFDASLRRLRLEYVDLYLLHWPVPSDFQKTVESYRVAEKLLAEGRARAIGVCNHSPRHLQMLTDRVNVVPAVNQVELHPFFTQLDVREANARYGIVTQSWSPIGGIVNRHHATKGDPLSHPVITALAAKHAKTPAQIVLRWHLDHGLSAIPKSARRERIAENFAVFDFALTTKEIAAIDVLNTGERSGPDPDVVDTTVVPVEIES